MKNNGIRTVERETRAIVTIPTVSGKYWLVEGDRSLPCEVNVLSVRRSVTTFLVRSIEKSPRYWEFHTLAGQLSRGVDWEGNPVPVEILRRITFIPR